jgi:hypothetical protein
MILQQLVLNTCIISFTFSEVSVISHMYISSMKIYIDIFKYLNTYKCRKILGDTCCSLLSLSVYVPTPLIGKSNGRIYISIHICVYIYIHTYIVHTYIVHIYIVLTYRSFLSLSAYGPHWYDSPMVAIPLLALADKYLNDVC